ncbi:MAG: helix-hairpin-helix domain-containing protein [Clostridiales Family XIII bacterium]|nr:helix-hairpin-helix domain-containing protein [Clostridiales Family XIII bacterium]
MSKALKQPKVLFIAIAVVGIAAVTLMNGAGPDADDAGDVLRADAGVEAGDVMAGDAAAEGGEPVAVAETPAQDSAVANGGADDEAQALLTEESPIYVDVYGAVVAPSVYELENGSRVYDAIEMAGGLAGDADIRYINRAAALSDGDRVYVPTKEETESGDPLPASAGTAGATPGASQGAADAGASGNAEGAPSSGDVVNINTADSTALQILNGVGPATAQKIIDYRDSNGAFAKTEDLKNVSGIGDKTYEKLKDHICV